MTLDVVIVANSRAEVSSRGTYLAVFGAPLRPLSSGRAEIEVVTKLLRLPRKPEHPANVPQSQKIKNYVWHGAFISEVQGSKAWLDADLAALPRTQGGLAVPDLRVELMAMAAVIISKWAVLGSHVDHIVGDILLAQAAAPGSRAPATFVTPNAGDPPAGGFSGRSSIKGVDGFGPVPVGTPLRVVDLQWNGPRLVADGAALRATTCHRFLLVESAAHGHNCLEWLPYATLMDLNLINGQTGTTANRNSFRRLLTYGGRRRDVIHWRCHGAGLITFTLLFPRRRRTTALCTTVETLALMLITNYPRLLYRCGPSSELRIDATPADQPVIGG
ncbi:hypothetical protein ON010_g17027 [Phytophthora cinnamomi]|nr:hypothetical protein ON010_g17027 [Phytophthora cinnamomi]